MWMLGTGNLDEAKKKKKPGLVKASPSLWLNAERSFHADFNSLALFPEWQCVMFDVDKIVKQWVPERSF